MHYELEVPLPPRYNNILGGTRSVFWCGEIGRALMQYYRDKVNIYSITIAYFCCFNINLGFMMS